MAWFVANKEGLVRGRNEKNGTLSQAARPNVVNSLEALAYGCLQDPLGRPLRRYNMTDVNKETISVLNDLIETSKDGEAGFKDLAEHTTSTELKAVFTAAATDTASAAVELQALVRTLGGDPETTTSVAGDLHRRWVDLKSAVTGKDDLALLNEAERGEDVAKKSYKKALENTEISTEARALIQKQFDGVMRNHDKVKALRDQARAQQ
jgi:uncharacterized protein (TIGR02284 family)